MKTKAAVLYEMERPAPYADTRPLALEEVDLEKPGPGEVLVQISAAGLCHSDLSVINGTRPWPTPLVLGILFVSELLSGLGVMILDINAGAFQTALTPDRLRARVTGAFRFVNYGVRPLGALLGGALGSAIGVRSALWFASIAALAGILWMLPSPIPLMYELPESAE